MVAIDDELPIIFKSDTPVMVDLKATNLHRYFLYDQHFNLIHVGVSPLDVLGDDEQV
jgi:hypothetical protein